MCVDKSVVVVGPGAFLRDLNYGEDINNFDLVVRTNDGFLMPPEFWDDYGSRCDILYLNNAWIRRNILKNKSKEHRRNVIRNIVHTSKVRLIVVKKEPAKKILDNIFSKITPKYKEQLNIVVTAGLWRQDRDIWAKAFTDNNRYYEPTLVPYIISDLSIVEKSVKQIFITGCDFYNNTQHWASFYNKAVDQRKETITRQKAHNTEADKEYLKKRLMNNDKIQVDTTMRKLLNQ